MKLASNTNQTVVEDGPAYSSLASTMRTFVEHGPLPNTQQTVVEDDES